jgi:hypothetical protein
MNRIESSSNNFRPMALALLTTVFLFSSGAAAKEHKTKKSDNQPQVVAHISFAGLSAVDMALQKDVKEKYYLYVQHSQDEGISIVDVSKPAQPKPVAVIPWPDQTGSSRMNVTGNLAFIAERGAFPAPGSPTGDDLVLWDLSNPTTPRVVQKFAGVVRWLQDERNFTYVLNADGLWIVSQPALSQSEPGQPFIPFGD